MTIASDISIAGSRDRAINIDRLVIRIPIALINSCQLETSAIVLSVLAAKAQAEVSTLARRKPAVSWGVAAVSSLAFAWLSAEFATLLLDNTESLFDSAWSVVVASCLLFSTCVFVWLISSAEESWASLVEVVEVDAWVLVAFPAACAWSASVVEVDAWSWLASWTLSREESLVLLVSEALTAVSDCCVVSYSESFAWLVEPMKKVVPTKTEVTPTLSFLIVYLETLLADLLKYRSRLFFETICPYFSPLNKH